MPLQPNNAIPKNRAKLYLLRHLSRVYLDTELHCAVLQLLLNCLVDASGFNLNERLTSQYPLHNFARNYLFIIEAHLKSPGNRRISLLLRDKLRTRARLAKWLQVRSRVLRRSSPVDSGRIASDTLRKWNRLQSMLILLKLLSPWLSDFDRKHILGSKFSSGAYSTVHHLSPKLVDAAESTGARVVKLVSASANQHDRNSLFFLFSEIKILKIIRQNVNFVDSTAPCPGAHELLELVDYGFSLAKNAYYLIFPKLEYLQQKKRGSSESLTVTNRFKFFAQSDDRTELACILRIMHQIIQNVKHLHLRGITHFDIKADNVMYRTDSLGCKRPVLIDFGESLFGNQNNRLRGTEYMKSPEMLINNVRSSSHSRCSPPSEG